MTPKGIPGSGPKYTNTVNITPAVDLAPEPAAEAIVEPLTAGGAIKHLISELGLEFDVVSKVDISLQHASNVARIRILSNDRSMRSRQVELPVDEEDADE